jgi:hypothetical protein
MTPEIIKGILEEVTAIAWDILTNNGRTVDVFLLEKFNSSEDVSTTANFVIISFAPSPGESQMQLGGLTKMCFTLSINVYCYFDDQAISNELDVSLSYIADFDYIRNTFNKRTLTRSWATESMQTIKSDYGFVAAFVGVDDADSLPDLANTKGFKLVYECVSMDSATLPNDIVVPDAVTVNPTIVFN